MTSKRITLSKKDSEILVSALRYLRKETSLDYEVIRIGKVEIDRLIELIRQEELKK